jgi:hypothetical protein
MRIENVEFMHFEGTFDSRTGQYREPPIDDDSAVGSDDDMSIDDPMDVDGSTDESDDAGVAELVESFSMMGIKDDFFETFFDGVGIDEEGRSVRRSPRLGNAVGSFFVAGPDGRTLRRSNRIRGNKGGTLEL